MKTIETNGATVIKADSGKWLTKDGVFSDTEIYLGKFDKLENWKEISDEEKQEIEKANEPDELP
jgi:hypothetical protein